MEDKELQELFAAKRTAEANRRRQEELAAMIAGKAKRTRPLWPVWAGAAAASIAILIFALPALFRTESSMPVEIARTEAPEIVLPETTTTEEATPIYAKPTAHKAKNTSTISLPQEDVEPQAIEEEQQPMPTVEQPKQEEEETPAAPVRRVMRRTSTLIACTKGCPAPEGMQERSSNSIQIEFFAGQEYADATVYTFANKK